MKEEREKLIREKIAEEDFIEMLKLKNVRQRVMEILIREKNFKLAEIETDAEFTLELGECKTSVTIDFIINLSVASFMVIKCTPSAIESWERYVVAFARVVKDYQIPYAAVADGENIKIFDVPSGTLTEELFLSREEANQLMKNFRKIPCPSKKTEKEKRIIYAFESIKYPIIKDNM